jgi:DNA-directed RNA polymerase specialized sigma24 family protein
LLEEGNLAALLAKYQPVILGRCIARLQGDEEAEDVAQNVMIRLVAELERGKRYSVPYRVVVHKVTTWTLAEYFEDKPTDLPLPESWEPAAPDVARAARYTVTR